MKRLLVLAALFLSPTTVLAERATYDLVRYTPPAAWKNTAWKKAVKAKNNISYTMTDKQTGTYCQIFILNSTVSKGDLTADFESEWKDVVIKSYGATGERQLTETVAEDGWQVKAGVATFAFDKGTSIVMMTTIRGYDRVVSIVAVTSSEDYLPAIQELLASVEMKKPAGAARASEAAKPAASAAARPGAQSAAKPIALQGYMDYNPFTKTWTWKLRYPPPKK